MYKKLFALSLIMLLAMSGISSGASVTTNYDPFHLSSRDINSSDEAVVYSRYGNGDSDFFYQLRDVTGASRNERVAGPQWFATVYENYYNHYSSSNNNNTGSGIYRRTMGGETPDIPFRVVGDILDGFNFVFAEEPEPYAAWINLVDNRVYDVYPDPLETLCIVITNGQGELNVKFGNPYARHFPFWWNWNRSGSSAGQWWQNEYDWRTGTYATTEPIEYIYYTSDNGIYSRSSTSGRYEKKYNYVSEQIIIQSGDEEIETGEYVYYVQDLSGDNILLHSGDVFYNMSADLAYTLSGDEVYDADDKLVYTLESAKDDTTSVYICAVRNIGESITVSDFNDDYTITLNPSSEGEIPSGSYLDVKMNIRGTDSFNYGSRMGYITFRQRASFAPGYTNFREAEPVPFVIANVSDGNASDNPLIFDMTVTESNDVVNRIKFRWDAQSDMPDQDLGTFFMIQSADSAMPVYDLETAITNRTGTRYMLYRYDMGMRTDNNYREILPDYWRYDLTQDLYGTLPSRFLLDAHSQIAPGLVTVYKSNVGSGYSELDTQYDTSESFRLYEYASGTPRNLRLNYKRVGGMTKLSEETPSGGVRVREFSMQFADVAHNSDETVRELQNLTGKTPVMISADVSASSLRSSAQNNSSSEAHTKSVYIRSSAIDAFQFLKDVPEGLVSYDIISEDETSGDETSGDNTLSDTHFYTSDTEIVSHEIALQPLSIRMKIPRQNQLLVAHWDELDNAENSRELFNIFSRYGAVWVRSSAAAERDTNMFTAINNKGANTGVSASDCVSAFIYNDALYIDFIAVTADGKSTNANRTAYIEIFRDDNVPYVLIGDGAEDGKWDLTFFIDAAGDNPIAESPDIPGNNVTSEDNNNNNNNNNSGSGSSSGGGGCNAGMISALAILILAGAFRLSCKD